MGESHFVDVRFPPTGYSVAWRVWPICMSDATPPPLLYAMRPPPTTMRHATTDAATRMPAREAGAPLLADDVADAADAADDAVARSGRRWEGGVYGVYGVLYDDAVASSAPASVIAP